MGPNEFFTPVARELNIVESNLDTNIETTLPVLQKASTHLIKAGGKRLRPAFALLAARVFVDNLDNIIPVAVALELTHMATLVHDDVIDNSQTRRGTETVKQLWGNRLSINAGNYIFSRSLSLVAGYGRTDMINVLADASMKICEGEIFQMLSAYNTEVGLKNYLRRIERKTALLISVSCQLGAMLTPARQAEVLALQRYGYYLGMAFQVTDDILDFVATEQILGKPTGNDVRQGIITLPAIYALRCSPHRQELAQWLSSPQACLSKVDTIIDLVIDSGGIDYAYHATECYACKAKRQLQLLPNSLITENLANMADFISTRDY
ncbi:MAG: polyprenyl synthetase family protein [Syntrophomonadaceae bacterium]|jgi:heptaprenyl diphosphate synthase